MGKGAAMARRSTNKTVGYGYVGRWSDSALGWFLPECLSGGKHIDLPPDNTAIDDDDRFVLCKITIEAVPGKRTRRRGAMYPRNK